MWIDTHCHLDAPEFGPDHGLALQARALATRRGVQMCVLAAVTRDNFESVRSLAHRLGDAYALGIHPLYAAQAQDSDLQALDDALTTHRCDPRLVAVGEIGLDFFSPSLTQPRLRAHQEQLYRAQLALARKHALPVILHVRRSADTLLKHLRELPTGGGIAHAFNGSTQQARAFIEQGFVLGLGGALTFERATRLRSLAVNLPLTSLVLETDAPDMPPHWLYTRAAERACGQAQGLNTPAELPRIGQTIAALRGISAQELARATSANALRALPRLAALSQAAGKPSC